jgi:hypothetical protein
MPEVAHFPQKWTKISGSYINIVADAIFVQCLRVDAWRMLPGPMANAKGAFYEES